MGRDAASKLATLQQEGDTRTLSEGRHCELRQQRCRIHANNLGKGQRKQSWLALLPGGQSFHI